MEGVIENEDALVRGGLPVQRHAMCGMAEMVRIFEDARGSTFARRRRLVDPTFTSLLQWQSPAWPEL